MIKYFDDIIIKNIKDFTSNDSNENMKNNIFIYNLQMSQILNICYIHAL
jgi:hypothetical protein